MSFAYGAYLKTSEIHNQITNDIANILSFYECPDFCKGRCCKISKIPFGKDEYDKMLTCEEEKTKTEIINHTTKLKNLKRMLLSQGVPNNKAKKAAKYLKDNCFEFNSIVCPLLDNGKCKIHDLKPRVCNLYPFRLNNSIENAQIMLCFMGEAIFFDYMLMCCDIYAKKYNLQSENFIVNDLVNFKKSLEEAKKFQNFILNSEEGDQISKQTHGMDKAFLRLNLFYRYKSQINDNILQQKRDAMKVCLQSIEFIGEEIKFNQDNYRDFINKINEYAEPSLYDEFYKDAYIIDNSDLKTSKY